MLLAVGTEVFLSHVFFLHFPEALVCPARGIVDTLLVLDFSKIATHDESVRLIGIDLILDLLMNLLSKVQVAFLIVLADFNPNIAIIILSMDC